jgi:hypothetical protein
MNPNAELTPFLDRVNAVDPHIWKVLMDREEPVNGERISWDAAQEKPANLWALEINSQLIERAEDMADLTKAQNGLEKMFGYLVRSAGNLQEARRLEAQAVPHPKSKHHWKPEAAVINRATLEAANLNNELDGRFHPESFIRGVNRSVNVDPWVTPARPKANSDKEYTRGFDDDVDAGRREAANPRNPLNRPKPESVGEGEGPKKSSLKPSGSDPA